MTNAAGMAFALAAYGLWGVMPAYWKQLAPIPAAELTAWRALCSAAFGVLVLVLLRRSRELALALRSTRDALPIAVSAALLGANWLVFILAVQTLRLLVMVLLAPLVVRLWLSAPAPSAGSSPR